jgi:translocation and assembly module TamB
MKKRALILTSLLIIIVCLSGLFLYLRSPLFTELIRRVVTSELSRLTEKNVTAGRIYLNPFPVFIDIEDLRITDRGGISLIKAAKIRLYIDPSGILRHEINIPHARIEGLHYQSTVEAVRSSGLLSAILTPKSSVHNWKFVIKNITLSDGSILISDPENKISIAIGDIEARSSLKKQTVTVNTSRFLIKRDGIDPIEGTLKLGLDLSSDQIRLDALEIRSEDSFLRLKGSLRKGEFVGTVSSSLSVGKISEIIRGNSGRSGDFRINGGVSLKIPEKVDSMSDILSVISLDLSTEGTVDLETLMEIFRKSAPISGSASFRGTIKGTAQSPEIHLRAGMGSGRLYGIEVQDARSSILYKERELSFYDGSVSAYNGKADVEVNIHLKKPLHYRLEVKADSLESDRLFELLGWHPGLSPGTVSGHLLTEGRKFEPHISFHYSALRGSKEEKRSGGQVTGDKRGIPFLYEARKASGSIIKSGNILTVKDLSISLDHTLIASDGSVNLKEKTIDLYTYIKTDDIRDLYRKDLLSGKGEFRGTIKGSISDPTIEGSISACSLTLMDTSMGCLDSELLLRAGLLKIKRLDGRYKGATYSIMGAIRKDPARLFTFSNPVFQLKGAVAKLPLSYLETKVIHTLLAGRYPWINNLSPLAGNISSRFTLEGPLNNLTSRGSIQISGFGFSVKDRSEYKKTPYSIDNIHIETDFVHDGKTLNLNNMAIRRGSSYVRGGLAVSSGGRIESRSLSLSLSSDDIPWEAPLPFQLDGRIVVRGTLSSPEGEFGGIIKSYDLRSMGRLLNSRLTDYNRELKETGRIHILLMKEELTIDAELFDDRLKLSGLLGFTDNLPWHASVEIRKGEYKEFILPFLIRHPDDLSLVLNGAIQIKGTSSSISGIATLRRLQATLYGQRFINTEDIILEVTGRTINLKSLDIKTGIATLGAFGTYDFKEGYDLTAYGKNELRYLEAFIPGINNLEGTSEFVISITGPRDNPLINGILYVEDTTVSLKDLPNRIYSIEGLLYIDENSIVIENLSGRFASGIVEIKGAAQIRNLKIEDYNLEGTLKGINISFTEGVSLRMSGDLLMFKREETHNLTGDLRILRGRFTRTIDWKEWILGTQKATMEKRKGIFTEKVELNIKLYGDEDILIDNNLVRAPAKIDIVILGTMSKPSIIGRIVVERGKIFFRNNEFTILKASADFTDTTRIYPYLNIEARTRVKGYKIGLNLTGYIDQFSLSLSSDPTLEEVKIINLLTIGGVGADIKGIEGGVGVPEATSFLTGELEGFIEDRLKDLTGVDRFQVEPYISEKTGTVRPRVSASKRLLSDRMYITYTSVVGNTQEQFLKLEYMLSDRVILVGERDELGAIGADIKFRLEFR